MLNADMSYFQYFAIKLRALDIDQNGVITLPAERN